MTVFGRMLIVSCGVSAIVLISGFFLHMALAREVEGSWGTLLTIFGAEFLAVATLTLAVGLVALHA